MTSPTVTSMSTSMKLLPGRAHTSRSRKWKSLTNLQGRQSQVSELEPNDSLILLIRAVPKLDQVHMTLNSKSEKLGANQKI